MHKHMHARTHACTQARARAYAAVCICLLIGYTELLAHADEHDTKLGDRLCHTAHEPRRRNPQRRLRVSASSGSRWCYAVSLVNDISWAMVGGCLGPLEVFLMPARSFAVAKQHAAVAACHHQPAVCVHACVHTCACFRSCA